MNETYQAIDGAAALDQAAAEDAAHPHNDSAAALLSSLMTSPVAARDSASGLRFAELLALVDDGQVPVVTIDGHDAPSALRAMSLVDLHAAHVGRKVALMFANADLSKPVIVGLLQGGPAWPSRDRPAQVQVEADGARMVVSAEHQLELRCGKSRITLKRNGQVEIVGETIVSQAAAANRVRGGSVQLN